MKKPVIFFIVSFALALLNGYFFNYINDTYLHFDVNQNNKISPEEFNFIATCIAPFIETFLFQYLAYLILSRWIGIKNQMLCIIIMSIIFSSMHDYHWLYIIMTFFGGLILNTLYLYYYRHTRYSFMLTVLFHALFNLYGLLFVL